MSLLNQILARPLDAGYLEAQTEYPRHLKRSWWRSAGIVTGAIVLGIVTVWGIRSLQLPESAAARQTLEREAAQRSVQVEQQRKKVSALQAQLAELREAQAPAQSADTAIEVAAGTVAVRGPGLVITLDDAPAVKTDPENADPELRVRDSDIQAVVNGLWAAGAEAISINGHRATSLTTIRAAGSAIQVDLISLQPPYEISAIGDPEGLRENLAHTSAQDRITLLQSNYGIPVQVRTARSLSLPASTVNRLHFATAAP